MPQNPDDELVWVVPTDLLPGPLGRPNFLYGRDAQFIPAGPTVTAPENLPCMGELFMRRGAAERNEMFLQPIPYVILRQADGRLVRYRRLKEGEGEVRLAGRTSVGWGGHMQAPFPVESFSKKLGVAIHLVDELRREIFEEIKISNAKYPSYLASYYPQRSDFTFAGYLVDRSNAVGRVHLGLVYLFDLLPCHDLLTIPPSEQHKLALEAPLDPRTFPADGLDAAPDDWSRELEGWSRLVLANWAAITATTGEDNAL